VSDTIERDYDFWCLTPLGEGMDLRKKVHALKPVVMIGNRGLTEAVHLEIDRALTDHELITVKIAVGDRVERQRIVEAICARSGAECVQTVGCMAAFYRKSDKK
jgi:RNA-binding protein